MATHLQSMVENLESSAEWVRRSLGESGDDAGKARRCAEHIEEEMGRNLTDAEALPHRAGAPFEVSWWGLARY